MKIKLLDCVVLRKDLPQHGLRAGDVGTVVEIYKSNAFEIEFVSGAGMTRALVTLRRNDVRHVSRNEILAVRPCGT